mgnify:CR=1 FL=1
MNKRIVLLTGSELRHDFFRKFIASANNIDVILSYCESIKNSIIELKNNENKDYYLRRKHLISREQVEKEFFEDFCKNIEDKSNPIQIEKGMINSLSNVNNIIKSKPDLIISYGCSIIKSNLLDFYKGRFINIHLGLSPYYRGSGTNFWPFVNNELQFIGTTFMYIDSGIDTGKIIHQIRANIVKGDDIHLIGNRLIKDSIHECIKLIEQFDDLKIMPQLASKIQRLYKKKHFDEKSVKQAYINISKDIVGDYINNKKIIDKSYPIITNKLFE